MAEFSIPPSGFLHNIVYQCFHDRVPIAVGAATNGDDEICNGEGEGLAVTGVSIKKPPAIGKQLGFDTCTFDRKCFYEMN